MTQDQIADISWRSHDLLLEYIAIHDKAFQRSIRHVIPIPGIFKAIDFGALEDQSSTLISKLQNCKTELESILPDYSGVEREYLKLFNTYTDAVINTVKKLNVILSGLYANSQGFLGPLITDRKNYRNDLAKYHESVSEYQRIGEEINMLSKKLNA